MKDTTRHREAISEKGFTIINGIYSESEVQDLIGLMAGVDIVKPTFRKTSDLFAIRQFFKEVPGAISLLFTDKLPQMIHQIFGEDYFVVKSIYFDKPSQSNWFVAYHQDLTISVINKQEMDGFGPWTVKQDQYAVQPPLNILQNNFTLRIHLDDTDEGNGALRVIPGSHVKGVVRSESIDWSRENEVSCNVNKGGVMIMKPLLLHASSRTTNDRKRRVVHIEFSNQQLPEPLQWAEWLDKRSQMV